MNVSATQQLLVLALNNDGVVPTKEAMAAIVACGLFELENDGVADFKDGKARIKGELPADKEYLLPLYRFIEQREEVSVQTIMDEFVEGDQAGDFLAALALPLRKGGYILGEQSEVVFVPTAEAKREFKDYAVQAMDGKAPMTQDEAALLTFALGAGLRDELFGRAERKDKLMVELHGRKIELFMAPEAKDAFESTFNEIQKRFAPYVVKYVAEH